MSNDNYDEETRTVLGESAALQAMFESSGWAIAERHLLHTIAELENINTLDMSDVDVSQQIRDRINTVAALKQWLSDLKGQVENAVYMRTDTPQSRLIERR